MGKGGQRLAAAFEAVDALPALDESRRPRCCAWSRARASSAADVAERSSPTPALAIAVMRAANNGGGPAGRIAGVREAVEALGPDRRRDIAHAVDDLRPLRGALGSPRCDRSASAATRSPRATPPSGSPTLADVPGRDELAVAALLHDIGRLVLIARSTATSTPRGVRTDSPERARAPPSAASSASTTPWSAASSSVAGACRRRSRRRSSATTPTDAEGPAAVVRLGDLIAHHVEGDAVSAGCDARRPARRSASTRARLRELALRASRTPATRAGAAPTPARSRGARSTPCAASPRARSTSRSPQELVALGEHGPHPPAQRLPQDRRRRPRPGRPARPRPRLDLDDSPVLASPPLPAGWART